MRETSNNNNIDFFYLEIYCVMFKLFPISEYKTFVSIFLSSLI